MAGETGKNRGRQIVLALRCSQLTQSGRRRRRQAAWRVFLFPAELRLARRSFESGEWHYRYWQGAAHRLQILCDRSSVEIFINDGEGVMSSRYFPDHPARVRFEGASDITLRYWSLRACMIE